MNGKVTGYVLLAIFFTMSKYISEISIDLAAKVTLTAGGQVATIAALVVGLAQYIGNHGKTWVKENVVNPVKHPLSLMILATSDKEIPEIKNKIKALKAEMETDREFWKI